MTEFSARLGDLGEASDRRPQRIAACPSAGNAPTAGRSQEAAINAATANNDRERYLATMLDALTDILGGTVGPRETEGFVALVGMAVSEQVLARYLTAAGVSRLELAATLDAILDWKRGLGGDFRIVERSEKRIVLVNGRCPFSGLTGNTGPMCRMTSHVFGHMVAESQGYGRITLADTIARGSSGCRIVIDLDPEARDAGGQSYYARGGR